MVPMCLASKYKFATSLTATVFSLIYKIGNFFPSACSIEWFVLVMIDVFLFALFLGCSMFRTISALTYLTAAPIESFGGIQFNTALKQPISSAILFSSFGGIQFNTSLKPKGVTFRYPLSFGGIQFNTALKPNK